MPYIKKFCPVCKGGTKKVADSETGEEIKCPRCNGKAVIKKKV